MNAKARAAHGREQAAALSQQQHTNQNAVMLKMADGTPSTPGGGGGGGGGGGDGDGGDGGSNGVLSVVPPASASATDGAADGARRPSSAPLTPGYITNGVVGTGRPTTYLQKLGLRTNGVVGKRCAPRAAPREMLWHFFISFAGMAAVALLAQYADGDGSHPLIGSFAASAVLLYAAPESPLAQPRNCIGGHAIGAVVGVACWKLIASRGGALLWLGQALSVSLAILFMDLTRTLHPPAAATSLIALLSEKAQALGFEYVLAPVAIGSAAMLLVAVLLNNLRPGKQYPLFWI